MSLASPLSSAAALAVSLAPVLFFALALALLDGYQLIRLRTVGGLLLQGAAAAVAALVIHRLLLQHVAIDATQLARYVAPPLEELLKGVAVLILVRRHRVGFLVDASISGFAVGAGFAAVENLQYFHALGDPRLATWLVRGFGTAVMHGGATALFALCLKSLNDRHESAGAWIALPGFLIATVFHSAYNHAFLSPPMSMLLLLVVLPISFAIVFRASERATKRWLGVGFDTDTELLEALQSGRVSATRIGNYLSALEGRFSPAVLVDMVCLIRLHLELSIKAKGMLIAREHGFELPPDPAVEEHWRELAFLERSVGRAGLLAMQPIFNLSTRDLWQVYYLGRR
ncbi:MAG TPA: PrsW family glutamic-type intramembrane protease [Thermoanaerobaculia bacterium]|nr:PrsW family glutamic-type intramembrane protease [Thermoanaerobaculia bacterium]